MFLLFLLSGEFLFHFHQEAFEFLFTFCHKGGVICISEVIDVFPTILIPACVSSSPAFLMMYSAYPDLKLKGEKHLLSFLPHIS